MNKTQIGKIRGGKTQKSFVVNWNPRTMRVWIEEPGFFSPTIRDTGYRASSAEMAMHVAEAFCYNK